MGVVQIIARSAGPFYKIGKDIAYVLKKAYSLHANIYVYRNFPEALKLVTKNLGRKFKALLFIGPLTEPSLLRYITLDALMLKHHSAIYGVLEGIPLIKKTVLELTKEFFKKIYTPSRYSACLALRAGLSIRGVVPHGVNLRGWRDRMIMGRSCELKRKVILLTIIDELSKRKGLDFYLEALRSVKGDFLAIIKITTGLLRVPRDLEDKVKVIKGWLSEEDIKNYYSLCDVVVVPSLAEGFGLPIIEAFASGKPVITLDAAPMNEINSNRTGWLVKVERRDNVRGYPQSMIYNIPNIEDFMEKLEEAINDPKVRKEKAEAAYYEAEKYDIMSVYGKLIKDILVC